jgi:cytoskeletal protein RodZ
MLALDRVGDRLRAARLAAGLALSDIADKTRVPLRHLEAIESNDFSTLPSFTYATGFVRAFARVVGEDEVALIRDLRVELGRDQDSWTAASGGRRRRVMARRLDSTYPGGTPPTAG